MNFLGLNKFLHEKIESDDGDILKIDCDGKLTRSQFQPLITDFYYPWGFHRSYENRYGNTFERNDIPKEYIDLMLDYGYTLNDIEDLCRIPEALETTVFEILCEYGYCDE